MRLRLASPTAPTRYVELGLGVGRCHPGRYDPVNVALIGEMLPAITTGGNVIGQGSQYREHKFSIRRENRT